MAQTRDEAPAPSSLLCSSVNSHGKYEQLFKHFKGTLFLDLNAWIVFINERSSVSSLCAEGKRKGDAVPDLIGLHHGSMQTWTMVTISEAIKDLMKTYV